MANEPDLQKGQSGEWVQYLQQMLQYVGYWQGAVDGEFGDALEQAVIQLQTAYGLTANGVADAATWTALTSGAPAQQHDNAQQEGQHDQDSVYVDTSYLPITAALANANGDADTYLASIGIDPHALTPDAIA